MKTQLIFLTLVLTSFLIIFSCEDLELNFYCPSTSVDDCSLLKQLRTNELIIELQPGYTQNEVLDSCNYPLFVFQLATDFLGIHPDSIVVLEPSSRQCNCNLMLLEIAVSDSIWVDINNGPAGSMSPPEDQSEGNGGLIASVGMNYDINIGPVNAPYDSTAFGVPDSSCYYFAMKEDYFPALPSNCDSVLIGSIGGDQNKKNLTLVAGIDTGADPFHSYGNQNPNNDFYSEKIFYSSIEIEDFEYSGELDAPGGKIYVDGEDNNGNCNEDDVWGVDYFNNDNFPLDFRGHGTSINGIIASGRLSSESQIKMVTMQIGGYKDNIIDQEHFGCDLFSILCAVNYAVDNKIHIINMSLGFYSPYYHVPFYRQLLRAEEEGVLVVTSLGNDAENIDDCPHWPSNFVDSFPHNLIAVAALGNFTSSDVNFQLAPFSNYGQHADLAAPGWMIKSALAGSFDEYIELSGTSMAAAVVSRRAAMIRDSVILAGGTITAAQIKTQILQEAEVDLSLCVSGGRVLTHRSDSTLLEAIGY